MMYRGECPRRLGNRRSDAREDLATTVADCVSEQIMVVSFCSVHISSKSNWFFYWFGRNIWRSIACIVSRRVQKLIGPRFISLRQFNGWALFLFLCLRAASTSPAVVARVSAGWVWV